MSLSQTTIAENSPINTKVGVLSTTDSDDGDSHTYTILKGGGNFNLKDDTLRTSKVFDLDGVSSYDVEIRSTDRGGKSISKMFTIKVVAATSWERNFGGAQTEAFYSVVETKEGGYAISGRTNSNGLGGYDFWLVVVDKDGKQLYEKTYGSAYDDYGSSIINTGDGYILGGYTSFNDLSSYERFRLIKTDASGNQIWNKTYGHSAYGYALTPSIVLTRNGYAMIGFRHRKTAGNDRDNDLVFISTDPSGKEDSHSHILADSDIYTVGSMIVDGTLTFIVVGYYKNQLNMLKITTPGSLIWNKQPVPLASGGRNEATSVIKTGDNGYLIAGHTSNKGKGGLDFWLIKTDSEGKAIWDKTYGGSKSDYARAVIQTSDGGYAVAGSTESEGAGGFDILLIKTDSQGKEEWRKTFGGSGDDGMGVPADGNSSLLQAKDGAYVIAGYMTTKTSQNGYLIKYKREK